MDGIILGLLRTLSNTFGYTNAIRIKHATAYFSGFMLGFIVCILFMHWLYQNVYRDNTLDRDIALFYIPEKKSYVANPRTAVECFEVTAILFYAKVFIKKCKKKPIDFRSAVRTKAVILGFLLFSLIVIVLGVYFTAYVVDIDDSFKQIKVLG
jgi:hypothetical protein